MRIIDADSLLKKLQDDPKDENGMRIHGIQNWDISDWAAWYEDTIKKSPTVDMNNVVLTKSQCVNLAKFIDLYLLTEIRENEDLDNLDYVKQMLDAKDVLEKAGK